MLAAAMLRNMEKLEVAASPYDREFAPTKGRTAIGIADRVVGGQNVRTRKTCKRRIGVASWQDAREQWYRVSYRPMPLAKDPQTHESAFLGYEGVDRHPRAGYEPLRRQYLVR